MVFSGPDKVKVVRARLREGEPFATLAEEHVAGGGKASRTRPMPLEAIPEGMREAVAVAPAGEVVQYDGAEGNYLIKVLEKIEGEERSYEEAEEDVREHLRELREQKILSDWYEAQVSAADVVHLGKTSGDGR